MNQTKKVYIHPFFLQRIDGDDENETGKEKTKKGKKKKKKRTMQSKGMFEKNINNLESRK